MSTAAAILVGFAVALTTVSLTTLFVLQRHLRRTEPTMTLPDPDDL